VTEHYICGSGHIVVCALTALASLVSSLEVVSVI
jgi:hypothetical protein